MTTNNAYAVTWQGIMPNLLEQKKVFTKQKIWTPTGLVWNTNMGAMTSCADAPKNYKPTRSPPLPFYLNTLNSWLTVHDAFFTAVTTIRSQALVKKTS